MTAGENREDLIVLTADKDMEFTLKGRGSGTAKSPGNKTTGL